MANTDSSHISQSNNPADNVAQQTIPTEDAVETPEQQELRITLSDPRLAVPYMLQQRGYQIGNNGTIRNTEGDAVLQEDLLNTLLLDYPKAVSVENSKRAKLNEPYKQANDLRKKPLKLIPEVIPTTDKRLEYAFKEFHVEQKAASLRILRARLAFTGESTALRNFCVAVFGPNHSELEVYEAVLAHWLSGIKRKMKGDLTWNCESIVPIFYGPQNVGKSSVIRMLVSPLADYVTTFRLHSLCDDRNGRVYSENFVNVFDEASAFKRADADEFKNLVTATQVNYRVMRTNSCERVENRLSFIGSSNESVDRMIKDTTGARRLFQFDMKDKADFAALNEMDFVAIYQSIDERRTDYLNAVRERVQSAQEKLVTEDPIKIFIEEFNLLPKEGEVAHFINNADMYAAYKSWAEDNGHDTVTAVYLGKVLRGYGIESAKEYVRISKNGRPAKEQQRGFKISSDTAVMGVRPILEPADVIVMRSNEGGTQ